MGIDAELGDFPYMVKLYLYVSNFLNLSGVKSIQGKGYDWQCAGALISGRNHSIDYVTLKLSAPISERYVLTAAHCPTPTVVRLHDVNLPLDTDDDLTINVAVSTSSRENPFCTE
jgi:hypothetical protein